MIEALLSHPEFILLLAWAASRLQILIEVRTRIGASKFNTQRYFSRRWPQIAHSAMWTVVAYALVLSTGAAGWLAAMIPITPPVELSQMLAGLAFLCGVAADQVIERITSQLMGKKAGEGYSVAADDNDITSIVADLNSTAVVPPPQRDEA